MSRAVALSFLCIFFKFKHVKQAISYPRAGTLRHVSKHAGIDPVIHNNCLNILTTRYQNSALQKDTCKSKYKFSKAGKRGLLFVYKRHCM